jgi:hypothetical protein
MRFAAFLAANGAAVAALGVFAVPRLATSDAPASLTRTPTEQVVNNCPWHDDGFRARVLRNL